jgi:hypothetical protein
MVFLGIKWVVLHIKSGDFDRNLYIFGVKMGVFGRVWGGAPGISVFLGGFVADWGVFDTILSEKMDSQMNFTYKMGVFTYKNGCFGCFLVILIETQSNYKH